MVGRDEGKKREGVTCGTACRVVHSAETETFGRTARIGQFAKYCVGWTKRIGPIFTVYHAVAFIGGCEGGG